MGRKQVRGLLLSATLLWALPAGAYTLGSGNTAPIEPPVPHPAEAPCVVTLFANAVFGASPAPIAYAPPAACPGPWARVVLDVDISVDPGIQYDRTGTIFLGGAPLWFGTTSEPSPGLGPKWRVERDVTDDTALLSGAQTGFALIANYTNSVDTSLIHATGTLKFYAPTASAPAPATPDIVVAVAAPGGGTVALTGTTSTLTATLSLPKTVSDAWLDIYLQSQQGDEFWYTCVPNALAGPLSSCGGGAFREGEVSIDGVPAGVAPIAPWIYTGGIDPYLWAPLPGVQTLDFRPFRVQLGPFAGLLADGNPHTLAVSVFDSNNYFSAAGTFYAVLDHNAAAVTGGVLRDSLTASPVVTTHVHQATIGSNAETRIGTGSRRDFTIIGEATGSNGRVVTTVHQTGTFGNDQNFLIGPVLYTQAIRQDTETTVDETHVAGTQTSEARTQYSYPLDLAYAQHTLSSGNYAITTTVQQSIGTTVADFVNGAVAALYGVTESVAPKDTLLVNSGGQITGNRNQSSTASYFSSSTSAGCLKRTLAAAGNVLTAANTSTSCR